MPRSSSKRYYHLVWSVKHREDLFDDYNFRIEIQSLINSIAERNVISILALNVQPEHCHCLVRLNISDSVPMVVKQLKGESATWIRKNTHLENFKWQEGYYCATVCFCCINRLIKYINNQDAHHAFNRNEGYETIRFR